MEDIRQCIHDQFQSLQSKIFRNEQATADVQLAQEASESLRTELDIQRQQYQQLQEQLNTLQQSELVLRSNLAEAEEKSNELQAAAQEQEARPGQFELEASQLRSRLDSVLDELLQVKDVARREERLRIEQERSFCRYRTDATTHLAKLEYQTRQQGNRIHTKEHECSALQQNIADLRVELESKQIDLDRRASEISQHEAKNQMLSKEMENALEKRGIADGLLQSVEGEKAKVESERETLFTLLENARRELHESRETEARLAAHHSDLQRQLDELQDAENTFNEQLQQAQRDIAVKLHQAELAYSTNLDGLRSRLSLSENARKESQAKLRQMETAHKQQLEHHEQKANAKFKELVLKSKQECEKFEAQRLQDLDDCERKAGAQIAQMEQELQHMRGANVTVCRTLISNTQQSVERGGSTSSQQSQAGKTRKKVDRQTNSLIGAVSSSNQRTEADERGSAADRLRLAIGRRESLEGQSEYFEEEFHNRYGSQVSPREQEAQVSVIDPDAEVVPETQDFEYAGAAGVIESQVSVGNNLDQDEVLSDLSTMPSEDLSEMLLDAHSSPGRRRSASRQLSAPNDRMQTPGRSAEDLTSDAPSTHSQGRPKSRANTASRMMPLAAPDAQRQRTVDHDGTQHSVYAHSDRSFRAEYNDSSDSMHTNNAAHKRTYAHLVTMPGDARIDSTDPGHKRVTPGSLAEQDSPLKKLRTSAQSYAQRPSSISKSFAPYTPAPTAPTSRPDANPSPSSTTGRRSSNRQSSMSASQAGTPRLSSTRNTRSKSRRYLFFSLGWLLTLH